MAESSWPDPAAGRVVDDRQYEILAARFSDDGFYGTPNSSPQPVTAGSGLEVLFKAGWLASVRGHGWTSGDTDIPKAISSNTSGSTRIDRAVLRLDRSDWTVRGVIKEGTPGAGAPSVTQAEGDTGVWEIIAADITVPNGAASVTVSSRPQTIGPRTMVCNEGAAWGATLGQLVYRADTSKLQLWNGSSLNLLWEDTGDVALSAGFAAWDPIAPEGNVGRRVGAVVELSINVTRVTSSFSVNDPDGSRLCSVPAVLRPRRLSYYTARFAALASGGGRATGRVEVRPDGEVWVLWPSETIDPGRTLRLTCTYLKP